MLPDVVRRVSENRKARHIEDAVDPESRQRLEEWYSGSLATLDEVLIEVRGGPEIIVQVLLGTRGKLCPGRDPVQHLHAGHR